MQVKVLTSYCFDVVKLVTGMGALFNMLEKSALSMIQRSNFISKSIFTF